MSSTKNWPAYCDDGIAITAGAASAPTLIADTTAKSLAEDVMVFNPGPLFVRIKTGGAGVAATAQSVPVPPQTFSAFAKGAGNTHIAAICPEGNQQIIVFVGEGA